MTTRVPDRGPLPLINGDRPTVQHPAGDAGVAAEADLGLRFHARNLFPPGGVIEDPATGAAAAAFGAYLRAFGHVTTPVTVDIEQGTDMGRPSHPSVHIPPGRTGIGVSGTAVELTS